MKELLAQIPLCLARLELRVGLAIREPWLGKVGIVRGHHQRLKTADLVIDEAAQLRRAVAFSRHDAAKQQREGDGDRY
jgi:hypothetical protein